MGKIAAPAPLTTSHAVETFDCGVTTLNEWLKRRALKNEVAGASRTFVLCSSDRVIGYYTLATGSVMHRDTPSPLRRNMPDPIPVMILGRLAVDLQWQQNGIGRGLLKDAILRCLAVSQHAGVKALVVHALSDEAKKFYLRNSFIESPLDSMALLMPLKVVARALE